MIVRSRRGAKDLLFGGFAFEIAVTAVIGCWAGAKAAMLTGTPFLATVQLFTTQTDREAVTASQLIRPCALQSLSNATKRASSAAIRLRFSCASAWT